MLALIVQQKLLIHFRLAVLDRLQRAMYDTLSFREIGSNELRSKMSAAKKQQQQQQQQPKTKGS